MLSVKQQYEQFPYPPVSPLALPKRGQGEGLRYEKAFSFSPQQGEPRSHEGIRILVAGAGTLEALVVAQMHPHAAEVVAIDISQRSLTRLKQRVTWARVRDALYLASLRGHRLPPIRFEEGDINQWQGGEFDYILASNVLHHTVNPAQTLSHLSSLLKNNGIMRVVTYACQSRFWIRQTRDWLHWHGLQQTTPGLKSKAHQVVNELPESHSIRSCFSAHGETASTTGLIDAFFNACENPLMPLQWQQAAAQAGLDLLGESQSEWSQSKFLVELVPQCSGLDTWQQLQVLDDVLELSTSPVWWFCKQPSGAASLSQGVQTAERDHQALVDEVLTKLNADWYLPSQVYWQLGEGLRRAQELLATVDCDIRQLIDVLREEVGPRITRDNYELPGLSIGEYPTDMLLSAEMPISSEGWLAVMARLPQAGKLFFHDQRVPGQNLAEQAQWLQLRYGPETDRIGPLRFVAD